MDAVCEAVKRFGEGWRTEPRIMLCFRHERFGASLLKRSRPDRTAARTRVGRSVRASAVLLLCGFVSACQGAGPGGRLALTSETGDATRLLQTINDRARRCWAGDRAFRDLRIIPELDTRVGHPRILLVRAEAAQGLPRLVIQAEGSPARITTFGPLAGLPLSSRINADLERWTRGGEACR